MKKRAFHRQVGVCSAAAALILGMDVALAQQSMVAAGGVDDYLRYCAACHGPHGRGDGEMAPTLVKPPSDLTRIAERHGGFPFWRVYDAISGEVAVPGHETFQMPAFAERLKADEGKPGYLPPHLRILLMTHYLESLQGK